MYRDPLAGPIETTELLTEFYGEAVRARACVRAVTLCRVTMHAYSSFSIEK